MKETIMEIAELLKNKTFKVVKPRKNEETTRLIDKLSEVSGWNKRAIYFQVPHNRLNEAIEFCVHYSNPKLRNKKLGEFLNQINPSDFNTRASREHYGQIEDLERVKEITLPLNTKGKRLLLRNCVEPPLGLHILKESLKEPNTLFK